MLLKAPRSPEFRLILFCVLGWAMFLTFSSCAMFRTEPPHRVQMPLEIPERFEAAAADENPLEAPMPLPSILYGDTHPEEQSGLTGNQPPAAEKKANDVVASLIPPAKTTAPTAEAMYPGTPPSHRFSSFAPDLFFDDMDRASLKKVIANQLNILKKRSRLHRLRLGRLKITSKDLIDTLEEFSKLLDQNLNLEEFSRQIHQNFNIYPAGQGKNKRTLFTGYYTPLIEASRVRTDEYVYPLYDMPHDIPDSRWAYNETSAYGNNYGYRASPRKMPTRGEIDGKNFLSNRNLEVAWLKDDLERFFLHIQGSGILQYSDGDREGVQYVGSNMYPYKSVGKLMIRDRAISKAQGSMQGIKKYFKENPHQINRYLFQNKRYIFFRPTDRLPTGSGGAELVAGRSIATDKTLFPAGGLAFIMAKKPVLDSNSRIIRWENFLRFVLDQDTGSAIKGKGRADLYFGTGHEAGVAAGHYMQRGKLFYLVKK